MKLRYILIPFLAVLLMSHNAGAISLNIPVSRVNSYSPAYWSYKANNVWANFTMSTVIRDYNDPNIGGIAVKSSSNGNVNIKTGDYVEIRMLFTFRGSNGFDIDGFVPANETGFFDVRNGLSHNTEVVSIDWSSPQSYVCDVDGSEICWVYHVTITGRSQGNNSYPIFPIYVRSNVTGSGDAQLEFYVSDMTIYTVASDADKEEEATQEASDDSENTSNEANEDVESGTSNLLDVFGGFVTAITGASASNCVINAPLNTSFSNDRLNVDLCGLDLPTPIGVLTSIIAILVVVPFAISMFNKFIGIIGSFQQ